jgi:uncharacterized membrane protein YfcA
VSPVLFHVVAVIFLATMVRSTFGFGEALVAVPLLALRIPVSIAAPLAVLLSITVAGIVLAQDWRHVHLRPAAGLLLATLPGIPLGLLLLTRADERIVKSLLAAIIIGFSAWSLLAPRPTTEPVAVDRKRWLFSFGFLAGILGGAYGMNGPPLVIYATLRRWTPQRFRATLQGYFLPASAIGMLGYWVEGLWVPAVTRYYLWSLPASLVAIVLGREINRRLQGRSFIGLVHVGLIAIGLTLLAQALRR